MSNTITVTIPFSFKGIEHKPSVLVDLDVYTESKKNFNSIFHIVASENNIGNFSYEYEVLETSSILFTDPTGLAVEFLTDSDFDLEGFIEKKIKLEVQVVLQDIAREILNIDNLEENEAVNNALLKAYQIGERSNKSAESI